MVTMTMRVVFSQQRAVAASVDTVPSVVEVFWVVVVVVVVVVVHVGDHITEISFE